MKKLYVSPLLEIIEAKGLEAVMESISFEGQITGGQVLGNSAIFSEDKNNKPVQQEEEEEADTLSGGTLPGNIDLWD